VPTIEDEIEEKRQKKMEELLKAGVKGTPVTPETFALWQEAKRVKRQAEIKKRVDAELRKKKGGKGLSVLSGRDLYEYKAELFKEIDEDNYVAENGDTNGDSVPRPNSSEDIRSTSIAAETNGDSAIDMNQLATTVQSELFLEGDDDDLDDLDE
jgi:DRG Family Regulatory Proteins, Tma46